MIGPRFARLFHAPLLGLTVAGMTKSFSYEGGPRDKETSQAEEVDFPEIHPGGEYRWAGISHSQVGARDPHGPLPEADRTVAIWHPKDGN